MRSMPTESGDEVRLDNPVWESLTGPHARFAEVCGRIKRYQGDVAPFLGMPTDPDDNDWRDAAQLVPAGGFMATLGVPDPTPEPWSIARTFDLVQMVAHDLVGEVEPEAVALSAADVPEMMDLVQRTEPGPFLPRTIELGDYFGIRRDGRLIAMAGERMRFAGWTEISAVCTDPAERGQGLATRLMKHLGARITDRSESPFLHAQAINTGAIRLYESIGFRIRSSVPIAVLTHGH
jgi:ribosomal protein S18 acetylase RimI-like enzyme